jgi:hypothetical protein
MKPIHSIVIAGLLIVPFIGLAVAAGAATPSQNVSPSALNSFTSVPSGLRKAEVFDEKGKAVGVVQKVDTDASGHPVRIEVLAPGGRQVAVNAAAASYDPQFKRVVTDSSGLQTPAPPKIATKR